MSSDDRLMKWARRRALGGGGGESSPPPAQAAPPAPSLPPAPAGHAWAWHPAVQAYVLVPVATPAQIPTPQQAWSGAPPPTMPVTGHAPAPRAETCMVVKPGPDTWADLLEKVPDLMPSSQYDAMSGQPSPESQKILAEGSGSDQPLVYRDTDYARRSGRLPPDPSGG